MNFINLISLLPLVYECSSYLPFFTQSVVVIVSWITGVDPILAILSLTWILRLAIPNSGLKIKSGVGSGVAWANWASIMTNNKKIAFILKWIIFLFNKNTIISEREHNLLHWWFRDRAYCILYILFWSTQIFTFAMQNSLPDCNNLRNFVEIKIQRRDESRKWRNNLSLDISQYDITFVSWLDKMSSFPYFYLYRTRTLNKILLNRKFNFRFISSQRYPLFITISSLNSMHFPIHLKCWELTFHPKDNNIHCFCHILNQIL